MKNIKIIIVIAGVMLFTNACDSDQVYEQELYKQVIALICSDNYNIMEDTQPLGEEVTGYVAVSCGGTGAVAKDVRISFIDDDGVLENYNWAMYDTDESRYAKRLPASKFDLDDPHITIPKGAHSGRMTIKFRPNGLSPDSAYFLPLSIGSVSSYEVNPQKSNILYRILIKNQYAEQYAVGYTNYRLDGFKNDVAISISAKPVQPISVHRVRMMAGDLEFMPSSAVTPTIATLEAGAVVLEMTGNRVAIKPYKEDGTLTVTQLDDDSLYPGMYPNTFVIEHDWDKKYKVFRLHYKYKAGSAAEVEMREELRLEFTD
jgi:hypothetical protein